MSSDTFKRPLSKELARLPGELVTRDITDSTKIHPHDPPHIQKHLLRQAAIRMNPPKLGPGAWAEVAMRARLMSLNKHPERYEVIDQALVDIYRGVLLTQKAKRIIMAKPGDIHLINPEKLSHVWFESPKDGSMIRTRPGPEPMDSERPAFLRNLKLTVDIMDWPQAVIDMLTNCGVEVENAVKARIHALRSSVLVPRIEA